MNETDFIDVVADICEKDPRYSHEAYLFVREALDFAAKSLNKPSYGRARHVSGQELLDSLRNFALQEFGPMAYTVLRAWNVRRTEDFGDIVFNLIDAGTLGKTEEDKRENFASGYDFRQAFVTPFLPSNPQARRDAAEPAKPRGKNVKQAKSRE